MFNNVVDLISFIETQKRLVPKISLNRFRKICEIFGNPQEGIKYIHVGGTNGKGSTVSLIKNVLRKANFNVATYISPYIIKFNERITYNDEFISDDELLEIGNYILGNYPKLEEHNLENLSFFEFVTLLAFIYFSRLENLDLVILEVGLGGLLDVTNIITPLISVITNVNYDHMNVLGTSIEEIAYNKLGIVKENIPLITIDNPLINEQILKTVEKTNSQLILINKKLIENIELGLDYTKFDYKKYKDLKLSLLGIHQAENATLALEVIKLLNTKYNFNITDEHLYEGFLITKWPGRLEVVSKDPVIILDGAHNIDGIRRLKEFIEKLKEIQDNYIKIVFAVSSNKQKEEMIPLLEEVSDEIIFSSFHYVRSDSSTNLLELSQHKNKRVEDDLDKLVLESKNDVGKTVIFCGSLYFISEIFKKFKR